MDKLWTQDLALPSLVQPLFVSYSRPYETNVSAEEAQARQDTRFPLAPDHEGSSVATPQGPQATLRLTVPPSARLSGADIRAFRAQRRFHGALLSIGVAPLSGKRRAKIGIIVSKKVAPKANERNALKRLLREALRPLSATLPPFAILVNLKVGAGTASKAALRQEISQLAAEIRSVARE